MSFNSSILGHPPTDDITQEAMRRIADKKHNALKAAREQAIHDTMRRLEYRALTKCMHGHPSDERQWTDFQRQYNLEFYKSHGALHPTLLCSKCAEEKRLREKEEICRAAEIALMERQIAELQTKIALLKRN